MIQRRLISLGMILMTGALTAAAQKPIISVSAQEVRIDVLVTDNGKPVAGMRAEDFEVFDNGVPQEIQYITLQKQTPITAILVFDMSRSVAGELLSPLKDAARGLLADLRNEDHAALITFSNAVTLGSPPTGDFARVKVELDRAKPFGNSSLIDGSYAGLILAQTRPDPTLLIIFSDGRDTSSWLTADAVLETAKHNDAVVYAVSGDWMPNKTVLTAASLFKSVGRLPKKTFLNDLTKYTGGSVMKVESTEDLAAVFLNILEEFRQRYLVTYTPQGVSQSGWHKLDVRAKNRAAKVMTRPGYMRSSLGG